MKAEKHITIQDIARACGVGIASVSRVINGKTGVRPAVRTKILRMIDEIGWQCNALPLKLGKEGTNRQIIFLTGEFFSFGHSVMTPVILEVMSQASLAGYDVAVLPGNRKEMLEKCIGLKPYALVESSPVRGHALLRKELIAKGVRYLSLSREHEGLGISFYPDFFSVGKRLVKTLRLAGHRKIGCFSGLGEKTFISTIDEAVTRSQERFFEGIASAHKEFVPERDIVGDNYGHIAALRKVLKEKKHTAWICDDWKPCMLFLQTAWELKLRIPEDISLITIAPEEPVWQFPLAVTRCFPDVRKNASEIMKYLSERTLKSPENGISIDFELKKEKSIREMRDER